MTLKAFVLFFTVLHAVASAATIRPHIRKDAQGPDTHEEHAMEFVNRGGIVLELEKATVTANNLGGHGPWNGEQSIRLDGVANYEGRQLDLRMEADSDEYHPHRTDHNGKVDEHFLQINILKNTSTVVKFTILDHTTNESVVLPLSLITIWDFDMGNTNKGYLREQATIVPVAEIFMRSDSLIEMQNLDNDTYYFYATVFGNAADNPTQDRSQLTTDQKRKAVGIVFSNRSTWNVTLAVSELGSRGRNFLLSGTVPPMYYADNPCINHTYISFAHARVVYSNLGGMGPDADKPLGLKIANVSTLNGQAVDLVVNLSSMGVEPYRAHNASKNGLHGQLGNINIAPNSNVRLNFSFMQGGVPVELERFFITFYDIDSEGSDHPHESLHINSTEADMIHGFAFHHISNDSALMVTQENGTFGFAATEYGNYHDNPDHPEDLDHVQLSRAVAFFFNSSMSSFSADYSVRRSRGGRNVLFGGASRVACADEAMP